MCIDLYIMIYLTKLTSRLNMNETISKLAKFLRRNAILFTLSLSIVTTCFVVVNYFATTNLRLTQLANAEIKVEQDEKVNSAEHSAFITREEMKVDLKGLQDGIDAVKINQSQQNQNLNLIYNIVSKGK